MWFLYMFISMHLLYHCLHFVDNEIERSVNVNPGLKCLIGFQFDSMLIKIAYILNFLAACFC